MANLIRRALTVAGYECEPTADNLIDCYIDYANAYGKNMDEIRKDIVSGAISFRQMCNALIRSN